MAAKTGLSYAWDRVAAGDWDTGADWLVAGAAATTPPGPADRVAITGLIDPKFADGTTVNGPGQAYMLTILGNQGSTGLDPVTLNGNVTVTHLVIGNGTTFGGLPTGDLRIINGLLRADQVILNGGTLTVGYSSAVELGTSPGGYASGAVTVDAGKLLSGNGTISAALVNDGTVAAKGPGRLAVGPVTGTGILQIGRQSTLELTGAADTAVQFVGAQASLWIDNLKGVDSAGAFSIAGFEPSDLLSVESGNEVSISYSQTAINAGLFLINDGTTQARLRLLGNYVNDRFFVLGDAIGVVGNSNGSQSRSTGTTTGHSYYWFGSTGAAWNDAKQWIDETGNGIAAIAPGSKDAVTIDGYGGLAIPYITGSGNSASLTIMNDFGLVGQFTTGALTTTSNGALYLSLGKLVANSANLGETLFLDEQRLRVFGQATLTSANTLEAHNSSIEVGSLAIKDAQLDLNYLDATSSFEVGNAVRAAVDTLSVDSGATLTSSGLSSVHAGHVVDDGTITITDGTLSLGDVSGTGTVAIDAGATLSIGTFSNRITFAGANATLTQTASFPPSESNLIDGFAKTDLIDLLNLDFATAILTPTSRGTVTEISLTDGSVGARFLFDTLPGTDHFAIKSDGSHGAFLYLN